MAGKTSKSKTTKPKQRSRAKSSVAEPTVATEARPVGPTVATSVAEDRGPSVADHRDDLNDVAVAQALSGDPAEHVSTDPERTGTPEHELGAGTGSSSETSGSTAGSMHGLSKPQPQEA